jgi:flagellar motor switch protein FliN
MASNWRVLELWFEIMRTELEELVRVPVTSRALPALLSPARAFRSQLLFEGSVRGAMYVTVSASNLVELSQMVADQPVDPHAAWTEEGLQAWQLWLTAASGKLAIRLSEELGGLSENACTILLQGTTAVDDMDPDMDPASGGDDVSSGAAIQQWLLQAAGTEFALSVSAHVIFLADNAAAADAEQLEPDERDAPRAVPESDETVAIASPSLEAMPEQAAVSCEDPQVAQPVENHSHPEPQPDSRRTEEPSAQDPDPHTEFRTKQRLDLLLDIELEATLRFGALELPLREVLELGPGDVLPLDRHVREPVELVVGDRIVAKGEVVLVGGNFALHVTEVAEPRRRLETIRCLF